MKIAFLSRTLTSGGAEQQLKLLARGLVEAGHDVRIYTFYDSQSCGSLVATVSLGKSGRWDFFAFFLRLVRLLRKDRPDILHAYLPMANVLALLASRFLPGTRIVLGMRASNMDLSRYDTLAAVSYRLERCLARSADLIIANAEAVRIHAVSNNYPADRLRVIPNGFDTDRFRPRPQHRDRIRRSWGLPQDAIVIGTVGRLDPMKDHETFLQAGAQLVATNPKLRLVVIGGGTEVRRQALARDVADLGLQDRVLLLGESRDVAEAYSAMDVFVLSSSFGEGFPNVVGEAMSCERPCVVTDVGDAAKIVGDAGVVVRPRDASALAGAIGRVLALPAPERDAMGAAARRRIVEHYSVKRLVDATERAFGKLQRN